LGIQRFCGNETLIFLCAGGKKGGEVARMFLVEKHSSDAAPDAGSGVTGRVWWLTLGAAQLGGCTGTSDGLASDAGRTLFSVRCLLTWRLAEELESTGHGGASDGDASNASDARFRARGAYWTASDTAVVHPMKSIGVSGVNLTERILTIVRSDGLRSTLRDSWLSSRRRTLGSVRCHGIGASDALMLRPVKGPMTIFVCGGYK
jgi:hypothetical protein